jgi:hypothetical protein
MVLFDYLIHLPNKILFPFFSKDKEIYNQFQIGGYTYFENNFDNIQICKEIMLNIDLKKIEDLINLKKKINPKIYSIDIFETLSEKLKNKLTLFFNNNSKIKLVSSMLGYKTKFRKVSVLCNFYNSNNIQDEGPKMFHRDSDSLQDQVKIFLLVNDISDKCGMFYYVPNNYINEHVKLPFETGRKNMKLSDKWRNYDSTVNKFLKKGFIHKLKGKQGEALYIDTGKVYHKGGYVSEKNEYRILIQAVYTPLLSLSDWNKTKNKFLIYIQQKLTSLRIKLRSTLVLN